MIWLRPPKWIGRSVSKRLSWTLEGGTSIFSYHPANIVFRLLSCCHQKHIFVSIHSSSAVTMRQILKDGNSLPFVLCLLRFLSSQRCERRCVELSFLGSSAQQTFRRPPPRTIDLLTDGDHQLTLNDTGSVLETKIKQIIKHYTR